MESAGCRACTVGPDQCRLAAGAGIHFHFVVSMETAQSILESVFGYSEFRGQQREIIEHVIDGGDSFVLMPTGGGKSLCYQIPALVRPGVAIVVSPLIALMSDQVTALRQLGVAAAC